MNKSNFKDKGVILSPTVSLEINPMLHSSLKRSNDCMAQLTSNNIIMDRTLSKRPRETNEYEVMKRTKKKSFKRPMDRLLEFLSNLKEVKIIELKGSAEVATQPRRT